MSNKITRALMLLTLLVAPLAWVHAAGSGGGGGISGSAPSPAKPRSPEQIAAKEYKSGLKAKQRAWKLEEKAAKASSDKKRARLLDKAQKQYEKAKNAHATALQIQPKNHEAANELGYALRKLGDHQKAIGAYNYALKLEPDFLEAVEYRGEAFLALGFFDQTKKAYMRLFAADEALAAQLMSAMTSWLAEQSERTAEVEEFATWLQTRQRLVSFSSTTTAGERW